MYRVFGIGRYAIRRWIVVKLSLEFEGNIIICI